MRYFTLFPMNGYWGKWFGGGVLIIAVLLGALFLLTESSLLDPYILPDLQPVWLTWLFAMGLFLFTFSKEKVDDERVQRIRYVALRGAGIMGFLMPLLIFSPFLWDNFTDNNVVTIEDVPIVIAVCVIVPLLIFQLVFNIGLRLDPDWAYNDSDDIENLRHNKWLRILLFLLIAFCIGMLVYKHLIS